MNERRYDFKEFVQLVKDSIRDYLPKEYRDANVSVQPFQKLNRSYLGLQVKNEGQMVVPNINLDAAFRDYQRYGSLEDVMEQIAEQVKQNPEMNVEWLKDYDQVKDKLFIRVSDAKENAGYLDQMPHKEVDGLAITYHIAFEGLQGVEASIPVTKQMMEMFGIDADQLHVDAIESGQRLYPVKFNSLGSVMQDIATGMGMDPDLEPDMMPQAPPLMVLTNTQGFQGAAVLFYPGQLDAVAQQMGQDFFVLPSSVHETLILADDGTADLDSLQMMVREINMTTVAPEDRLSDFVYHYDTRDHVLEKGETFAIRVSEKEQEAEKAAEMTAHSADAGDRSDRADAGRDTASGKEERSTESKEDRDTGSRRERKSVLGRLNEKKEQIKSQPKKDAPARKQEASL